MVPTFAFFCLNAGAMLTMGHKRCGRNTVTTVSEVHVKDTGWRAHPQDTVMGRRRPAPWDREEAGEAGITASEPSPQEDTEELTLRQVLRNETRTVKLRRAWV